MKTIERVLLRLAVVVVGLEVLIVTVAHYFWIVALAVLLVGLWRIAFGPRL